MHHVKLLILSLLLSVAYVGYGQVTFDSTLVYNQKAKLGRFYFDLMQHVGSVKVINEDGYDRSIASPNP
ncbi:hypothetical protein [Sphingobacterium deserti]|uniref:Uncharacterized protein n=1 Tax=Sphingobacterium deserti TaxID=1229276 RepID=A0A0B8SZQ5_9SPHI|nr:hypothetical protein [Sphingobacterium deserti]KGE13111.1 hypothetical protein DI53_3135 [Sphingobacterium deserti]